MNSRESTIVVGRNRGRRLGVALGICVVLAVVAGLALFGLNARSPVRDHAPGLIAFVHASYEDRAAGLDLTIRSVPTGGGPATTLIDLPGSVHAAVRCCAPWNPTRDVLAGPAVRWSPDGSRIAFRLFNDEPGIYVMSRDGSGLSRLVLLRDDQFRGLPFSPAIDWSPDGNLIAFTYPYANLTSPIHIVDTRDGVVTRLPVEATHAVSWSPDGTMLLFARADPERVSGLFVVGADGTGERRLDNLTGFDGSVVWSPDDSQVAASGGFDPLTGLAALHVMNADGTEPRVLNAGSAKDKRSQVSLMTWSPDGSRIGMVEAGESGRS